MALELEQLESRVKNLTAELEDFQYAINRKLGSTGTKEVQAQLKNGSTVLIGSSNSAFRADQNGIYLGNATFASAPFRVTMAGAVTATSATITGSITATSGAIAGWILTSTALYKLASGTPTASPSDGLVIDGSATPVITAYENTEKRLEVGYLSAGVYGIKGYDDDGTTVLFELSDTQKALNGSILSSDTVAGLALKIGNQSWSHDLVFSSTDLDTVAWASGTITMADGSTTYSITGANTGNMAARTYVYLDIAISTTVLQTTTTASTAVGDGKVLIAVAENSTTEATFQVFGGIGGVAITGGDIENLSITAAQITANTITANEIAANTITANEIAANTITASEITAGTITATEMTIATLSAITANMGTITAGTITGGTIQTAASGARVELGTSGIRSYDATTQRAQISNDGSGWFGSSTDGVIWDTAGTLTVENVANLTSLTAGEALTAGNAVQMGYNIPASDYYPSDDSYTDSTNTGTNYGSNTAINIDYTTTPSEWRGYFKFDLSNLPTGNLTSATLYIYFANANSQSHTLQFYYPDADWTEGAITWANQPGLGNTVGSPFTYDGVTSVGYKSHTITTSVAAWLSGGENNYGLVLKQTNQNGSGGFCTFNSSEAGSNKPYLVLVYDTGKVFKASALNSTNTAKLIGFCYANAAADASVKCQVNGTFVTSGLTAGSVYYITDTRGTIGTSAGTVSKKAGIALSTTKFLVDRA